MAEKRKHVVFLMIPASGSLPLRPPHPIPADHMLASPLPPPDLCETSLDGATKDSHDSSTHATFSFISPPLSYVLSSTYSDCLTHQGLHFLLKKNCPFLLRGQGFLSGLFTSVHAYVSGEWMNKHALKDQTWILRATRGKGQGFRGWQHFIGSNLKNEHLYKNRSVSSFLRKPHSAHQKGLKFCPFISIQRRRPVRGCPR